MRPGDCPEPLDRLYPPEFFATKRPENLALAWHWDNQEGKHSGPFTLEHLMALRELPAKEIAEFNSAYSLIDLCIEAMGGTP